MERRLVSDIVGRLQKQLPWEFRYQGQHGLQHGEAVLEVLGLKEGQTLINLCRHRGQIVLEVVCALLDNFLKSLKPGLDDIEWLRLSQSHYIILDLIRQGVRAVEIPVMKDKCPLDHKIIEFVTQLSCNFLQKEFRETKVAADARHHPAVTDMLMNKSGEVIFALSSISFGAVFRKVDQQFQLLRTTTKGVEDTVDMTVLSLIEFLHYDYRNLNNMLLKLSQCTQTIKNKELQYFFARVLRKAIWSWIYNNPAEFAALSQKIRKDVGDLLPTGAESLFLIVDAWADNSKKKTMYWPVQTMLLVLCPDLLFQALDAKTSPRKSAGAKFLENLKKSMKVKQLVDTASLCYVDICKASTFVKKAENNALRYIVPSIESELKERLFNPTKPILMADGTVDQRIMVDCMVSAYRLNARNVIGSLFPLCLDSSSPPAFRLVLLQSLELIACDLAPLPWNPAVKIAYGTAPQLRAVLQDLINPKSVRIEKGKGKAATKIDAEAVDQINLKTLETLLRLYLADPAFALVNVTGTQESSTDLTRECRSLLGCLCQCLVETTLPDIAYHASKLLSELHRDTFIEQWCPPDVMKGFWEVSAEVVNTTARMLIHKENLQRDHVLSLIDTLIAILEKRNDFLKSRKDDLGLTNEVWEMRKRANTNLEVSFLIHLCSGDTIICSRVSKCFGLLCDEVDLLEDALRSREEEESRINQLLKSSDIGANYPLWRQLSKTGVLATGRVAQQKGIHQLLRDIDTPTEGVTAAWQMVYRRWDSMTKEILRKVAEYKVQQASGGGDENRMSEQELLPSAQQNQWHFYSGMLAALASSAPDTQTTVVGAGADMDGDGATGGLTSGVSSSTSITSIGASGGGNIGLGSGAQGGSGGGGKTLAKAKTSSSFQMPVGSASPVEAYLRTSLEVIVCGVPFVAEPLLPILASTLNAVAYATLFTLLHSTILTAFGREGEVHCDDQMSSFVSQAVVLVERILERTQRQDDLALADFETLINAIVKYTAQLPLNASTLRIKAKICSLIEHLMGCRELISFKNEKRFRNKLIYDVMEWTAYFEEQKVEESGSGGPNNAKGSGNTARGAAKSKQQEGNSDGELTREEKKLQGDLDNAGIKSISLMLNGLSLESTEASKMEGLTPKEIKTMLFETVFVFLSGALTRSKQDGAAKRYPKLPGNCVDALSNLLYSNIEIGLEYFINMGYIDDTDTRSAFLVVLTNILKRGAGFATLGEGSASKDKYTDLQKSLFEDDLVIPISLLSVCAQNDWDELGSVLIGLFDSEGEVALLLQNVLGAEIARTESENTLFRRNSGAARLFFIFSRTIGLPFLRDTFGPLLDEYLSGSSIEGLEVDPDRLSANIQREQTSSGNGPYPEALLNAKVEKLRTTNLVRLEEMAQKYVDRLQSQLSQFPHQLREILHHMEANMKKQFPSSTTTTQLVGGFVFLRFINPALVSADVTGLTSYDLNREARRTLILLTKVLQNLGNNVKFGSKESYMEPMNNFIDKNAQQMAKFASHVSSPATENETAPSVAPIEYARDEAFPILHYYLQTSITKIGSALTSTSSTSAKKGGEVYDNLISILSILGPAPEVKKRQVSTVASGKEISTPIFRDFMGQFEKRSTEDVEDKQIFYRHGVSIQRHTVFYLVLRKFDPDMDMDLLIYHILKTLQPYFAKMYDIVVDSTAFSLAEGTFQMSWIQRFLKIIPPGAANNMHAMYIINPSSYFYGFSKLKKMISGKSVKKFTFLVSSGELNDFIASQEVGLPPGTQQLEGDVKSTFSPVWKLLGKQKALEKEIVLKVSTTYLHVISPKETVFGRVAQTHDYCAFGDVVKGVKYSGHGDDFAIIFDGYPGTSGESVLNCRSSLASQVVQAIQKSMARQELVHKERDASQRATTIRPEDVPGAMLNMALLNLGSVTNESRVAAYNLLTALVTAFKFKVGGEFLEAEGLFVPKNITHYVIRLSSLLARSESQITLEFLSEALHNFSKVSYLQKSLCLEYMQSWIQNLGLFVPLIVSGQPLDEIEREKNSKQLERLKEIIGKFVQLTLTEKELYSIVLKKIWPALGEVDSVIPFVVDALVNKVVKFGVESRQAQLLFEMCISLGSSTRSNVLSDYLVRRLLKTMVRCRLGKTWSQVPFTPPPAAPPPIAPSSGPGTEDGENDSTSGGAGLNDSIGGTEDDDESGALPNSPLGDGSEIQGGDFGAGTGTGGGGDDHSFDDSLTPKSDSMMMDSSDPESQFPNASQQPQNTIPGTNPDDPTQSGERDPNGPPAPPPPPAAQPKAPPPPIRGLISHSLFPEIICQCRLLQMLAFQDLLHVERHAPELFHIVLMLFPETSALLRNLMQSLLIDMIHSLVTIFMKDDAQKEKLKSILQQLNTPKYRLLILGSSGHSSAVSVEKISVTNIQVIASTLMDVNNICVEDEGLSAYASTWLPRWQKLTSDTSFGDNIVLKLRAFVVLGAIAQAPVSKELLESVLRGMREGLMAYMTSVNKFIMAGGQHEIPTDDCDLAVSVSVCLNQLIPNIPHTSKYFKTIFWLGMALVQLSDLTIFPYAVQMVETILRTYDSFGAFQTTPIQTFLTDDYARPPAIAEACSRLEQVVGMRYEPTTSQFSFGIAGTLLKGLKHPSTKTWTSKLLNVFLDVSTKVEGAGPSCLGYLATLAPTSTGDAADVLWQKLKKSEEEEPELNRDILFSPQMLTDETSAILLVALLVTILKDAEYEQEQLYIYKLLRSGVQSIPSVFPLVQELLTRKMSTVLHSSQNQDILAAVLDIVANMLITGSQTTKRLNLAYLNQIGFQGLLDSGTFKPLGQSAGKKEVVLQLTANLVDAIIEEANSNLY